MSLEFPAAEENLLKMEAGLRGKKLKGWIRAQ